MAQEFIPNKIGRPIKYDPSMCQVLIDVAEQGGHVAQMCVELGIKSRSTFYNWVAEYPEFKEAYKQANLVSQAFYESALLAGGLGKIKNFNFPAMAMILNNKFGDEYKRSANGSNTEINIGSINSIENMDSKQLDQKIADLTKKLGITEQTEE